MSLISKLLNKFRGIYLNVYFYFNNKILFKDKYGLSYYLYKNTRPQDTFNIGVRTDDTSVLYTIEKILSSPSNINNDFIHCIDVGGYIGVVTLMMSKTLQKSTKKWKVHSFEPFQESFFRLQENINLGSFTDNVILNNVAVSDKPGSKTLKTYPNKPGQNHLNINTLQDEDNASQEMVKVITLKDYMHENNIKHVNICKIDTEGLDELVIKGLYDHLKNRAIDYFIFEYQENISFKNIKYLLTSNDYTVYYMVRNENILVNSLENYPKNSKSLLNLIAVSPNRRNNFRKDFNMSD